MTNIYYTPCNSVFGNLSSDIPAHLQNDAHSKLCVTALFLRAKDGKSPKFAFMSN